MRSWITIVALIGLAACAVDQRSGGSRDRSCDCDEGEICVADRCVASCKALCPTGLICVADLGCAPLCGIAVCAEDACCVDGRCAPCAEPVFDSGAGDVNSSDIGADPGADGSLADAPAPDVCLGAGCTCPGECDPGELETRPCGTSDVGACILGEQERRCAEGCAFGPWSSCEGAIEPAPEVCGDGVDQDCDGEDLVVPDPYEPNDSCDQAFFAGDHPSPASSAEMTLTFHDDSDVDYFSFTFNDRTASQYIIVSGIWISDGREFDLALYRSLNDCRRDAPVGAGNQADSIFWDDTTTNDTGTWYVRARRRSAPWCEVTRVAIRIQAS